MDATRGVTLRDIVALPAHLLSAALLVGSIPFRACKSDPRISYTLYIPPKQYAAVHKSLQSPGVIDPVQRLPLIANIHGTGRNAGRCRDSLIPFADEHGVAILAPLFPAGLDGYMDLDSYKVLRSKTLQADLVFTDILNEVSHIWPGLRTESITLMGFSGGGQFVHRFAYIYPERVNALVVGAPGRTTELCDRPWPAGVKNVGETFDGVEIDLAQMRSIKHILMIVGEKDGVPEGAGEIQEFMAKRLGRDDFVLSLTVPRTESLEKLHRNWGENGIKSTVRVVPNVGHSSTGVLPATIEWLRDCPALHLTSLET